MIRNKRLLISALTLSFFVLISCQRCQGVSDNDPLMAVPDSAQAMFSVQPMGALAPILGGLQKVAANQAQAGESAEQLKQMLGFDPATIEGLKGAGFDPSRALVLTVLFGSQDPLIIAPVVDTQTLLGTVKRLAIQLGRADKNSQKSLDGQPVYIFARSFGDREVPVAFMLIDDKRKIAFIGMGKYDENTLRPLLADKKNKALIKSKAFVQAKKLVQQGPMLLWLGEQIINEGDQEFGKKVRQIVASVGFEGASPWLDLQVMLSPETQQKVAKLFKGNTAPDIIKIADADALMAISGQADMASLIDATKKAQQDPKLKKMAKAAGVNLNEQMLKQMSGSIAAIVYLAPNADIVEALKRPPRSAAASGALLARVLRFQLLAGLKQKDDIGAGKMLALIDAYFAKQGLSPDVRKVKKAEVHSIELAHGNQASHLVHYAARQGQMLLGTGDPAAFDKVLQGLQNKAQGDLRKSLSADVTKVLDEKGNALFYLSFSTLVERLQSLANAPELSQPSLRSAALQGAEFLQAFKALALRVSSLDSGLHVRALLELPKGKALN